MRRQTIHIFATTGRGFMILLLLAAAGCGRNDETSANEHGAEATQVLQVDVVPVARSQLKTTLDLVGTLIPVRATTVVSDVDGIIKSFPLANRKIEFEENGRMQSVALTLDLGHEVRKGEVLVQIDPVDFELDLNVVKADYELAKRNLEDLKAWKRIEEVDRLQGALEEAEAAYDKARADLARSKQLLARKAVSQSAHDAAVMAARMAVAVVKQAKAALDLAKAGPTRQQLAVAEARVAVAETQVKLKQEKLDKTTVHAPYDAVISDRYVGVGDRVTAMPRVEIMQIIDPRLLFAQVSVPERYEGKIELGDVTTVTAAGVAEPVPARVELINSMVDPDTRTFRVRVAIDNRKRVLKAGRFVHVTLPVDTSAEVPVVPADAVTFTEGCPAVFVYKDGCVRKTPVKIGLSNHDRYEVVSGVSPGQLVVVGKISLLADGLKVSVKGIPATVID